MGYATIWYGLVQKWVIFNPVYPYLVMGNSFWRICTIFKQNPNQVMVSKNNGWVTKGLQTILVNTSSFLLNNCISISQVTLLWLLWQPIWKSPWEARDEPTSSVNSWRQLAWLGKIDPFSEDFFLQHRGRSLVKFPFSARKTSRCLRRMSNRVAFSKHGLDLAFS